MKKHNNKFKMRDPYNVNLLISTTFAPFKNRTEKKHVPKHSKYFLKSKSIKDQYIQ